MCILGWVMQIKTGFLFIKKSVRRVAPAISLIAILTACHEGGVSANIGSTETTPSPEAARSAFDFVNSIGANTHLNYFDRLYGNFSLVQRELSSIGIRHLRDGVHLQDPAYNAMLYGRWVQLSKMGIRFDAVVDPRSNLGPITPDLLQKAYDLSGHSIECFEGPNELDVSGMKDWTEVARNFDDALFRAARSMPGGGHVQVIGPSMAFARHGNEVGDLSKHIDFGNLHSYPAGKMPSAAFPEQINLARELSGGNAIVVTETGYHNALNDHHDQPAVSESAAAKYIPRLFLEDFAHGIPRTYLYEFLDEAPDPALKDNQLHWGLIRANGTEKPAFVALKNLISELDDTAEPVQRRQLAWALSVSGKQVHHLLLQKSTGEFDLIFWQDVPSFDTRRQVDINNAPLSATLTLASKAKSISIYEPALQEHALRSFSQVKRIPLEIPDHPLVVRILMP
jgi:hypothetical protein